jgi:hypothetical protein
VPRFNFKYWLIPVAATSLPLLQSLIYVIGALGNGDLLNQFSLDGTNRDSWADLIFSLILMGVGQSFIALLLVATSVFALTRAPRFRRSTFLRISVLGILVCGWFLWANWSFTANHCSSDGCEWSSPIAFDFPIVVFFGLSLIWNIGVFFYAPVVLESGKNEV